MVTYLLRLEGLAVFICCVFLYYIFDGNWLLFFILLLTPDIAALGYLINKKTGAILYNLFHTYTVPLIIFVIGFFFYFHVWIVVGLIWTAHIGMDRLFGYGLKYKDSFKHTHFDQL